MYSEIEDKYKMRYPNFNIECIGFLEWIILSGISIVINNMLISLIIRLESK